MNSAFPLSTINILFFTIISFASSLLYFPRFLISLHSSFGSYLVNTWFLFSITLIPYEPQFFSSSDEWCSSEWSKSTLFISIYPHLSFFCLLPEQDITCLLPFSCKDLSSILFFIWPHHLPCGLCRLSESFSWLWSMSRSHVFCTNITMSSVNIWCSVVLSCFFMSSVLWVEVLMTFCLDYLFKAVFVLIISPLRQSLGKVGFLVYASNKPTLQVSVSSCCITLWKWDKC